MGGTTKAARVAAFFISEDLLNDKSSESRRVALPGKAGHDCGNKYQGNFTHKKTGIRILVWEDRTSPSCLTALVR